jgi:hypothetical protein
MALSGIERLLDTRRGRGVWSGVEAASRTLWVSSDDSPVDRPTQEHGAFVDGQS